MTTTLVPDGDCYVLRIEGEDRAPYQLAFATVPEAETFCKDNGFPPPVLIHP